MDFLNRFYNACCGEDSSDEEEQQEIELPEHLADIREQIEFYFSNANLEGDSFMKNTINEREDRYVPASVFLRFNRVVQLKATEDDIIEACAASRTLQVDRKNKLVRSRKPFVSDPRRQYKIVTFKGFDESETLDSLKAFFKKNIGKVDMITMKKFNRKGTGERYFSGFVDIEMPSEEAAQKVVNSTIIYNGKELHPRLAADLKKRVSTDKRKKEARK